ncbi:quinoprotein dehydrogenase-associated SoxYZ-like carrier [Marinimicrococcus flavescens]|uniref:Quinoprotein dehydrogenase-associated SoxYZ-like carrier n=1 Tax=Marinimicrococcus flavescens TaxID=3031815 RepID=A0AAP3UXU6_9PROT|nr:quinoprotein dehydrogenase-associated SoxYZ-like carrier [Marinimicrococcus flavescens]
MLPRRRLITAAPVLVAAMAGLAGAARAADPWPDIKEALFGHRPIADGGAVIALDAPERALDAAVVPMTIRALLPQTEARWIKTVHLVIDENPAPLAAVFHLSPASGSATIETRVRVNSYTHVHAVAETSDGRLHGVSRFVKAAGGCSAPALKDADEAMARLGRMKLRTHTPFTPGEAMTAQLLISHPNYTGLQIDQLSRNWIPPDYVRSILVRYGEREILKVEADISLSEDPSITFSFVPEAEGRLSVAVEDSSERHFEEAWPIGPGS